VINWKELADQRTSDELLLQVDQALEARPESAAKRIDDAPLTDWADGPGTTVANDIDDEPLELSVQDVGAGDALDENDPPAGFAEGLPAFSGRAEDYLDDEEFEDSGEEEDEDDDLPRPKFGSLMSIGGGRVAATGDLDDADEVELAGIELDSDGALADETPDFEYADDAVMALDGFEVAATDTDSVTPTDVGPAEGSVIAPDDLEVSDAAAPELDGYEVIGAGNGPVGGAIAFGSLDPAEMELGDWLAAAREMAAQARNNEDRTRNALYEAIGRAYDFSLAAADSPADFDELVSDSGLSVQDRAPMTPVVKLVFGADYDKTRLTEYAAALSHAHRLQLPRGGLTDYLRGAEGGLKGVVKAERQLRRAESGKADPAADSREALAAKLREMPAVALADIKPYGSEFALIMIRRSETGELVILGEVPEDAALVEKAAKKLVG
jgi:hypothetical protein